MSTVLSTFLPLMLGVYLSTTWNPELTQQDKINKRIRDWPRKGIIMKIILYKNILTLIPYKPYHLLSSCITFRDHWSLSFFLTQAFGACLLVYWDCGISHIYLPWVPFHKGLHKCSPGQAILQEELQEELVHTVKRRWCQTARSPWAASVLCIQLRLRQCPTVVCKVRTIG